MFGGGGWRGKARVGIGVSTPNTDLETKYGVAKKPPEVTGLSWMQVSFSPTFRFGISLKNRTCHLFDLSTIGFYRRTPSSVRGSTVVTRIRASRIVAP